MTNAFDQLWEGAKNSIFRLELLDTYDVEEEKESLEQFRLGRFLLTPNDEAWHKRLEETRSREVKIERIHVVTLPLSEYLKFEISYYPLNEKHGERVYLVNREQAKSLVEGFEDFWMFDDAFVLPMIYDKTSRFVGMKDVIAGEGARRHALLKQQLLTLSLRLGDFLRLHQS